MAKIYSLTVGRPRRGNMLILVAAFVFIIIMLACVFGLGFVRLLGSSSEQRTAIEAAALAAARDLSRIVINTPECGYVSLSDYAPIGQSTAANDGFALPVRSINTLIGTARLDLIIADKLNQQTMKDFAKQDMLDALSAKDQLETVLNASIVNGGTANDLDGNVVAPYTSAENAYRNNQIRMTGSSNYVAGSLNLALGSLTSGGATAIKVPQPVAASPVPGNAQINGQYRSYVNIPYDGVDFMFGGISNSVNLVDPKKWVATLPAMPYEFPTIVKAEADQTVTDPYNPNGHTIHSTACAQPATVHDPLPAPGALSISFPDGPVPEINYPRDCYSYSQLTTASQPVDLLTANVGDYPIDPGSNMGGMTWPVAPPMALSNTWQGALHDWLRRAGTKADINSVISMQNTLLDPPVPTTFTWIAPVVQGGPYLTIGTIPSGIIHIFKFDIDGVVVYQSRLLTPYPLYVSSHKQMYAEEILAIKNSSITPQTYNVPLPGGAKDLVLTTAWDVYIRDEVRNPGTIRGGKHAGEPLAKPLVVKNPQKDSIQTAMLSEWEGTALISTRAGWGTASQVSCGTTCTGSGSGSGSCGTTCTGSGSGSTGTTSGSTGTTSTTGTSGTTGTGTTSSSGTASTSGPTSSSGTSGGTTGGGVGGPGKGFPPLITPQNDSGDKMIPASPVVPPMPPGTGLRPFYETSGTAVDIRFRRQVDVSQLALAYELGYVGIVAP